MADWLARTLPAASRRWIPCNCTGSDTATITNRSPLANRNVYDRCMSRTRTNIELDDDALSEVMRRYGVSTKTEAVDLALHHLAGMPMTRDEALAIRGANAIDLDINDQWP